MIGEISPGIKIDLAGLLATKAELNYCVGLTSTIQTQLDAKADLASPKFTGTPLAPDHGAAATDMLVNVAYGEGAAPAANTVTEGGLYLTHEA